MGKSQRPPTLSGAPHSVFSGWEVVAKVTDAQPHARWRATVHELAVYASGVPSRS
jgi:hypothetical protein